MTIEDRRDDPREEDAGAKGDPGEGAPEEGSAPPAEKPAPDAAEPSPDAGDAPEAPPDADAAGDRPPEPESGAEEAGRPPERGQRRKEGEAADEPEVVPGADLEPDLVLEEPDARAEDEYGEAAYAERYPTEPEAPAAEEEPSAADAPAPRTPMELAADARYRATGKRKTSVARVILKPGSGSYTVNGRPLDEFFPRHGLRATARQPLAAAGYESRMDVVARLHGGGVSSQAGALRHGIARALVVADPSLREELKRRGYLTRDPRAKERRKAGLKKARKRPQFSKR
jgi:small subunit ribosomal protein S9